MLFPVARQSASNSDFSDDLPANMLDNRLGAWWRMGGFPGRRFPYDPRRPVNFDSPGPPAATVTAAPAAAVPPAIVPQLVGQFTTRRTQLFGPFANLM
jgi:hypothetical protein